MCKKVAKFFLSLVFSLIPLEVFAASVQTRISAETITVSPDGILNAEGNVIVKHGKVSLQAEALTFNKKNNTIELKKINVQKKIRY